MNIEQSLAIASKKITNSLKAVNSSLEANVLLGYTLSCSLEYLIINGKQILSASDEEFFFYLVNRRCSKEPVSYIIKNKEFYGINFYIDHGVLIPRPETELLVEAVLEYIKKHRKYDLNILDLGTGSGNIAITLAKNNKAKIIGVDNDFDAISIAGINNIKHDTRDRVKFYVSDWYKKLAEYQHHFDIIVSNPPYIPYDEKHLMSEEVVLYEPENALYADNHGMECFESIIKDAAQHLNPNSMKLLCLEIGFNQLPAVTKILIQYNFVIRKIYKDINKIDRVIVAELSSH